MYKYLILTSLATITAFSAPVNASSNSTRFEHEYGVIASLKGNVLKMRDGDKYTVTFASDLRKLRVGMAVGFYYSKTSHAGGYGSVVTLTP